MCAVRDAGVDFLTTVACWRGKGHTKRGSAPVTTPTALGLACRSLRPGCRQRTSNYLRLHHHRTRRRHSAWSGAPSPRIRQFTHSMALARPLPPLWQTLLPSRNGPVRPVLHFPLLQRLSQPFRSLPTPFAALAIPSLSLPSFPSLADIWEGVLKAVPKKKTSHRKKRQRFMAGKGLQDLTNLNRCSACGRVKRAHLLCPYCVNSRCTLETIAKGRGLPKARRMLR
jgi:ribosomal protein L32